MVGDGQNTLATSTPSSISKLLLRIVRMVLRAVIFLAGMLIGLLLAMVVSSFGGSATADFVVVFFGIGLMVAAPICWIGAVWSRQGDRWTVGYLSGWLLFAVVAYASSYLEQGKPIVATRNAGIVALAVLAMLYLVVLPVGVVLYRRRWQAGRR